MSVRRILFKNKTRKKLDKSFRVVAICNTHFCVNPLHLKALPPSAFSKKACASYTKARRAHRLINSEPRLKRVLDMEKAQAIRASYKTRQELAEEYGVSTSTIRDVLMYRTWNHYNIFSGLING